jgi:hypothetical protein
VAAGEVVSAVEVGNDMAVAEEVTMIGVAVAAGMIGKQPGSTTRNATYTL